MAHSAARQDETAAQTAQRKLRGTILEPVQEREAPRFATPESVREYAATLKTTFLECRDMGHRWQPFKVDAVGGTYVRVFRCSRCKTEREQTLDARGHIMRNSYEYPDGYQSKGLGRMDDDGRSALRLASIERVFIKREGS